jgi:hypothetical protein
MTRVPATVHPHAFPELVKTRISKTLLHRADGEPTAQRSARQRGCHLSPHGANNEAICTHSIAWPARQTAMPNRQGGEPASRLFIHVAYLGGSGNFGRAIADFAETYADQNERDCGQLRVDCWLSGNATQRSAPAEPTEP